MDRNPVAPQLHNDSSDLAQLEISSDFIPEVNNLILKLQKQGFEIRKKGLDGDRGQTISLYRDEALVGKEVSLAFGLKVALKNLSSQALEILDPNLKAHLEDVERLAHEGRTEAAATLTAERERGYLDLKKIISTKSTRGMFEDFKTPPEYEAILREAQADGISLVDNNSRTNGFYITDVGGETIGEVKVFLNPNWQNDLIAILEKHLKT